MTEVSSGNRWQLVAIVGIALALGVWFMMQAGSDAPENAPEVEGHAETVLPAGSSLLPRPDPEPVAITEAGAPALEELPDDGATAPVRAQTLEQAGELAVEAESLPTDLAVGPNDSSPEPLEPLPVVEPVHGIAESGRLSIDASLLRDGEMLALGLGLGDEARGERPLEVRVVSVDGRRLDTTAAPVDGSGGGLRLEIDPEWLVPGRYMIEVRTAEKTHFPLRRYVLEVSGTVPEPGL